VGVRLYEIGVRFGGRRASISGHFPEKAILSTSLAFAFLLKFI